MMPSNLDPHDGALWAIIAICLVLIGGILTAGQLGVAERGSVLVAIASALFAVAWRSRRRRDE